MHGVTDPGAADAACKLGRPEGLWTGQHGVQGRGAEPPQQGHQNPS